MKTQGFKGLDKNFKCRGFQFKEGKTYQEEESIICEKGFHFCQNPFDIFSYYPPAENRFAIVEGDGKISRMHHDSDTKVACSKLTIKSEISLPKLISAGVEFILKKINWKDDKNTNTGDRSAATNTGNQSAATNTGDRSAATNTGYQSAATNTGDRSAATNTGNRSAATNTGDLSAATNTGYQSAAEVSGKKSIACGLGPNNKARGAIGCWLVLSEWEDALLKFVKTALVDGENIKADTWYKLNNGEFVEVF